MEFFDHGVGMVIVRRSPPAFGELARPWRLGLSRCTMQTMSSSQAKRSRGANPTRNDIAITAFREGKLPFPDGAIIVALHWNESLSDENNKVLAIGFPNAALQSSVAGSAENVQLMANLAMRRSSKPAIPATNLPRIGTSCSPVMRLLPE
jgi:hypothetical protein